MSGTFKVDGSGNVELKEEDGIDYAPVTVQLAGGERVPFLFSIKTLNAKGTVDAFGGEFVVPSYRGSSFLDPKVWPPATANSNCHLMLPLSATRMVVANSCAMPTVALPVAARQHLQWLPSPYGRLDDLICSRMCGVKCLIHSCCSCSLGCTLSLVCCVATDTHTALLFQGFLHVSSIMLCAGSWCLHWL